MDSSELEVDKESGRHGPLTMSTSVRVCVPDIKKNCICAEMAAMYECVYVCCISLYMYMYVFTVFKLMCVFHRTALRALMM